MNVEMADNNPIHGRFSDNHSSSNSAYTPPVSSDPPFVSHLFEREPGLKQCERNGFYGISTHILAYDFSLVRSFISVIVSHDITAFATIWQWLNHFGMVMFALFLMIVLGKNAFPDGSMGEGAACSDDVPLRNKNMCQLEEVMENAKDDFQFLVAFILAGYVSGSLAVWASRRSLYASLCGSARNLMVLFTANISSDPMDEEAATARRTLCRWIMLAFELAMLRPRGYMDAEEGRKYLVDKQLLESGEWEALINGERHTTVNWWIQMELSRLAEKRIVSPVTLPILQSQVSTMRAQANDLMLHLDQDRPFPYVALCGILVKCNVMLMSTWKGINWSIWYYTLGGEIGRTPKFWMDILTLFAWNMGYTALYQLGYILHNPFRNRRIDVPHEIIHDGLFNLSVKLPRAVDNLPPYLRERREPCRVHEGGSPPGVHLTGES